VTPRFKVVDYSSRFLPVDLSRQLFPGTFEFALHHLLEHEIDLSEIDSRYRNHGVGASAYDPRILLKIVLLALRTWDPNLTGDGSGLPRQRAGSWRCLAMRSPITVRRGQRRGTSVGAAGLRLLHDHDSRSSGHTSRSLWSH
jgi:hypothetical protein